MTDLKDVCPDTDKPDVFQRAMNFCLSSDSRDPIKILKILMKDPDVPFHGPVHHSLVPFAVLTAYKNSGGDINLAEAMEKAHKRGSIIPAAVCGHWGACGAALGCGIAFSVITNDGPLAGDVWSKDQIMVSDCLSKIAGYGGPRCCKRDAYLAIPLAAEYFKEYLGVEMEIPEKIKCYVSENNPVCLKEVCPFNPNHKG